MVVRTLCRCAIFLVCAGLAVSAQAVIVDMDGIINCQDDETGGHEVLLALAAGSYNVIPVDISGGGAYTALNRWGTVNGCDGSGANCSQGWRHRYAFFAPDVPNQSLGIGNNPWETADLAFANDAESASFTLPSAQSVGFYATDSTCGDNTGGASVDVVSAGVPTIPIWGLAVLGVVLIAGSVFLLRFAAPAR